MKTTWIWTYFIVIISMGLIFLAGISVVRRETEEKAKQINYNNAVFMKNSLDDSWSRIYDYSIQIINNSKAKAIDNNYGNISHDAYVLAQDIRNYLDSNSFVEDVMLYYPCNNQVIGKKGVFQSHTYWAALDPNNDKLEYDTWMNTLFGNRTAGYFLVNKEGCHDIYYRISTPDITKRVLVARININELERTLDGIRNENDHVFLAMVDDYNNVFSCSGDSDRFVDKEDNTINEEATSKCICTEILSDIEGLKYTTATEISDVMATSRTVTSITLLVLGISVAIGVLVLIVLVNHNAKPIERILSKLASGKELSGNELEIIDEQIDDLMEKSQQRLEGYVHQQKIMRRRTFLNDSLRLDQLIKKDIETFATLYDMDFRFDHYQLIIRERTGDDNSISVNEYLNNVNESFGSIAWTQKQDLDIFLLNFNHDENGTDKFAEEVQDVINNKLFGSKSNVVASKIFTELEELRTCYLKCLRTLNRKEMVSISERSKQEGSFDDIQTEISLMVFRKCVIDEDYSNARKELRDVCKNDEVNSFDFRCRKYSVVTIMKSAGDDELQRAAEALDSIDAPKDFLEEIDKIFQKKIDEKTEEDNQADENDVAGRARTIIDESYNNPAIGLCMVAESVGLSQSYVSRIFNKKYKIGISQYINQVRLSKAKQLMSEGELSIKEIALKIGFTSDAQFIRVFKQYEGMTPGVYRDMMTET